LIALGASFVSFGSVPDSIIGSMGTFSKVLVLIAGLYLNKNPDVNNALRSVELIFCLDTGVEIQIKPRNLNLKILSLNIMKTELQICSVFLVS